VTRWLPATLWLCLAAACFAQSSAPETPAAPATPATPLPSAPAGKAPEEYEEEEFSPALKALRRGEIILFGSFPLTLFLSYETYDIYRFFANDRLPQYRPWPVRPPDAVDYEDWETAGVLVSAVSVSLALALSDYLIGKVLERRAAKRRSSDR
jgi:hypothetical protein